MKTQTEMILGDNYVTLRPLKKEDAPRFVKWLSDPEVNKFTTRKPVTLKENLDWIKGIPKNKDGITLAIDTQYGTHIGSVGMDVAWRDKKGQFNILIGDKKYWNRGYGLHASRLILEYVFKKLNFNRVFLVVYVYNPRAIKLYRKLGFKKEGVGRKAIYYRGAFRDQITMGILRNEWLKRK